MISEELETTAQKNIESNIIWVWRRARLKTREFMQIPCWMAMALIYRIRILEDERNELKKMLSEITSIASRVDGWESFPSDPIDRANNLLNKESK